MTEPANPYATTLDALERDVRVPVDELVEETAAAPSPAADPSLAAERQRVWNTNG